jgi:O-antigen/teichoic acid export membrane protein
MTAEAIAARAATVARNVDGDTSEAGVSPRVSSGVSSGLLSGASALGAGMIVERSLGFLANLLAARLGGAATFGAYSLAITTANNISTYAAGGIGSTTVRFSGKYSRESPGYVTLFRALLIISLASASIAAAALWLGAAPIARLLDKPSLTGLLSWAALSAAGMILLECCRGFLIGQRRLAALLWLSLTVGVGMVALLPFTSRLGPVPMIVSQGAVTVGAVAVCLLLYRVLRLAPASRSIASAPPLKAMLREIWSFGLVQLAGLIGMNAAGWWLTSLVARSDTSMVQMGFFAVSHQVRNMVALAPTLLTESSLAVMARGEKNATRTPDQTMALTTFATMFLSLLLAGAGILVAPWGLSLLYGKTYAAASAAASLALATAVVHMGSGPASARLTIVSIKTTGVINTIWAILVAIAATFFLFWRGDASKGMLIYLVAHIVSAVLVLVSLATRNCVPEGMKAVYVVGMGTSVALAALALFRYAQPALNPLITGGMFLLLATALVTLFLTGRRHGWAPDYQTIRMLVRSRLHA